MGSALDHVKQILAGHCEMRAQCVAYRDPGFLQLGLQGNQRVLELPYDTGAIAINYLHYVSGYRHA